MIEQKREVADFEWCSLGFAIIVTLVFVANFENGFNCTFILLVDLVHQCRDIHFCAGRLDRMGDFQVKRVVRYTVMEMFSG